MSSQILKVLGLQTHHRLLLSRVEAVNIALLSHILEMFDGLFVLRLDDLVVLELQIKQLSLDFSLMRRKPMASEGFQS